MAAPRKPKGAPNLDRLRRSAQASASSADYTRGSVSTLPAPALPVDSAELVSPVSEPVPNGHEDGRSGVAPAQADPTAAVPESEEAAQPERVPTASMDVETTAAQPKGDSSRDKPAAARQSPRPQKSKSRDLTSEAARQAVTDSYLSARHDPRAWVSAGVRLPSDVRARLEGRLPLDQEETGNYALALAHYVNAALNLIPDDDLETCVKWASDYLRSLGVAAPHTVGTGTRLNGEVARRMRRLPGRLRKHARYGLAGYLHAAAVVRLLDALDLADVAQAEAAHA